MNWGKGLFGLLGTLIVLDTLGYATNKIGSLGNLDTPIGGLE